MPFFKPSCGFTLPQNCAPARSVCKLSRNQAFPTIQSVSERWPIFDHELCFDPAADFDGFVKRAPAKWVVYLLADERDQPVQLLCVKNLRYSLRRRLGEPDEGAPASKRVDLRQVVRRV